MTFNEWWKQVEGWKTEGGSGESKARAAWECRVVSEKATAVIHAREIAAKEAEIAMLEKSLDENWVTHQRVVAAETALADRDAEIGRLRQFAARLIDDYDLDAVKDEFEAMTPNGDARP